MSNLIFQRSEPTATTDDDSGRAVPVRAILVALALIPINALWVVIMEVGIGGPESATVSVSILALLANVVCIMVALIGINVLLKRYVSRCALTSAELLVIYIMLVIASCLPTIHLLITLMPMLGFPARYANASNHYQSLFMRYIPRWFGVTDKADLTGWYEGRTNPYSWEHIRPWIVPLTAWGLFLLVLLFVMLCVNVLLRVPWTRHERLSFPIVQLPLDMTSETTGFFRNRLLQVGFGLSATVHLINGLHFIMPGVPGIPMRELSLDLSLGGQPPPLGSIPLWIYPLIVGLGYLMPADMSFSCWCFYLFTKFELVLAAAVGFQDMPNVWLYTESQCMGAYLGIGLIATWGLRRHLSLVIRRAWRNEPDLDSNQPFSYRVALLGVVGGLLFLMGFFYVAGLPLWVCAAAFALYFCIALACTRMRAEVGAPILSIWGAGPEQVLTSVLGTQMFSARTLTVLTYFFWFNRDYGTIPMPGQLEAFKMGEQRSLSMRGIAIAIGVASVAGMLAGFWALHLVGYVFGTEPGMADAMNYFARTAFTRLSGWIQSPRPTDLPATCALGLGFGITLFLHAMRMQFTGWMLHPIGLALTGSGPIYFSIFLGWLAKVILQRYGGIRVYRKWTFFFYGLILGDCVLGCAWPIAAYMLGTKSYTAFP